MYQWEFYGILLVAALVVVAWMISAFAGSNGPLARRLQQKVHELEVRIRMDSGEQLVQDLRTIAPLYVRLHKQWEAEQALHRALTISKQQWGERSPEVIAVLNDFLHIMRLSNHKEQAKFYKDELRRLRSDRH